VKFLGGVVDVLKGLLEYAQIKVQVSIWAVDTAPHAEKSIPERFVDSSLSPE